MLNVIIMNIFIKDLLEKMSKGDQLINLSFWSYTRTQI